MLKKIKVNPKIGMVIGITAFTLLWMLSGVFSGKDQSEITNIVTENKLKLMETTAQTRTKYLSFSAIGLAYNEVNLTPQITGTVIEKFVNDGDEVKKGSKIIQIRNDALIKRVGEMSKQVESARLAYDAQNKLSKKGLGSELDLDNAAMILRRSEADLTTAKTDLDNTIIIAPFDGIIDEIKVSKGDLVSNIGAGSTTIGRFINLESIEARAYLSQYERRQINNKAEAIIVKDDLESVKAQITFIASTADQNTGTFLVKAVGDNTIKIADGEAVVLRINLGDVKAHKVPISSLLVNKSGDLSVRILDEQKKQQQIKVMLVDEDEQGVWISGLPDKCNIVLAGQ